MGKRPVAVFDIDGTVFRSSLLIELVERLIDKGIFPQSARQVYDVERHRWLDRQGDYGAYIGKVVQVFAKQLKGAPYDEVSNIAGEVIEEKHDRVYRYTRDLVKALKKQGYFLLAISLTLSSTSFLISSSRFSEMASKRVTKTGCVLEARTNPQPSPKSIRTPSISTVG